MFIRNSVCTAASPFLVLYGDPVHLELSYQTKKESMKYEFSYIGLKKDMNKENVHYSSFMRSNNKKNFWYFFDVLNTRPLKKLLALPIDVEDDISFVIYICMSALLLMSSNQKPSKEKKAKIINIDVETKLCSRQYVQLVRSSVLEKYIEFDRT